MINRITSLAACLLIVHHICADQNAINDAILLIYDNTLIAEKLIEKIEPLSTNDLNSRFNGPQREIKNMTALMVATQKLNTPLVQYLLDKKRVDPNILMDATKPESKSALFFAIDNAKNKKNQTEALKIIDFLLEYGTQSPYAEKYVAKEISDKTLQKTLLKKFFCADITKLIVNAADPTGITNIINSPAGKLVNLQTEKNSFFLFNVATADQPAIKNVTFLMLTIYQIAKNASDTNKINNIMKTIQLWVNDHDVDINQLNSQEENPLIVALLEIEAHQHDLATVKYLLETITTLVAHGAKTDITYQGKTTAQLAATVADRSLQASIDDALKIIVGQADVDNLIDALKNKDQGRIDTLIATNIAPININLYSTAGNPKLTPLMGAAYYGNPEAVAALVQKKGVNLDLVNTQNFSALRFAMLYFVENKTIDESTRAAKVKQIVETLVKYGATPIINTNCDAIVAANSSLTSYPNIRDTLILAQAVQYIIKGGGAALGDLLKKYSGANLTREITINLAETGKNPVFFTGNLLKIFLHYVKETAKNTSGYLGDLNSLLAISGMSKSIDNNTKKSMLSFATFNLEFFKAILSKIDDELFLVNTMDSTGSSILLDTAQTMVSGSLNTAVYSLLEKIKDTDRKKRWVNTANKDGLKPVDAIIKRAGEFNATNKDMVASPLKQLKDAGGTIDTATINLVHALAPSEVKTAIETALDIPDHPVTPKEIITNISKFNATLENIQSILKTVKTRV